LRARARKYANGGMYDAPTSYEQMLNRPKNCGTAATQPYFDFEKRETPLLILYFHNVKKVHWNDTIAAIHRSGGGRGR